MAFSRVDHMEKQPCVCFGCGGNPTVEGKTLPAIDLDQDYDWGNNAYLCFECSSLVADLMGRVSPDEHEALKADYKQLLDDHKRLRARYKKLSEDTKKLVAGDEVRQRRAPRNRKREKV